MYAFWRGWIYVSAGGYPNISNSTVAGDPPSSVGSRRARRKQNGLLVITSKWWRSPLEKRSTIEIYWNSMAHVLIVKACFLRVLEGPVQPTKNGAVSCQRRMDPWATLTLEGLFPNCPPLDSRSWGCISSTCGAERKQASEQASEQGSKQGLRQQGFNSTFNLSAYMACAHPAIYEHDQPQRLLPSIWNAKRFSNSNNESCSSGWLCRWTKGRQKRHCSPLSAIASVIVDCQNQSPQ